MKALTIFQPYAQLIMLGEKCVENRSWETKFRGQLLIHAGKSRDWLDTYHPLPKRMDFGAIIGDCQLVDCVKYSPGDRAPYPYRWLETDPHAEGRFCYILEKARLFKKPVPCVGMQKFWDVQGETMAAVEKQLEALRRAERGGVR